ncbi:hypothetical protein [Nocardioides sp. GY 10127]|uniref:hypothetical protein n=1 Tax=Nocardioides sp. GY 10127 TaxID=2569762 RepID=UPI0010A8AADF|nr:hypothetical protein [Nocardioides sp. GY 10127]TIC82576.1 hypothetical protein E8D37_07610 [Nocardioides sp. GY 10127]
MLSLPRRVSSALLLLIAALLLPVWLVASWTESLVTDPDAYVEAVAPLGEQPEVQAAVADRVAAALQQQIEDRVPALSVPLVDKAVQAMADKAVASDAFPGLWTAANRSAHTSLAAALTSDHDDSPVEIDLTPVVEEVISRLEMKGLLPASATSTTPTVVIEIAQPDQLVRARHAYAVLAFFDRWLPWLMAALVVAAVVITPKRLRALLVGSFLGLLTTGLLALALVTARPQVLDLVEQTVGSSQFLEPTWDALLDSLWHELSVAAAVCAAGVLAFGLLGFLRRRRG